MDCSTVSMVSMATVNMGVSEIPKLADARYAGSVHSEKCTLILTEGDSAKALAMAGISVVGRDYYGVFPLKGKLLNVRNASNNESQENQIIHSIMKILGLQQGRDYFTVDELRYGHLMIMTDQDIDGAHTKGLIINFVHYFWPTLLRVPGFMLEFITPIVKARHRFGKVRTFYSIPQYDAWNKRLGGNASCWTIKYYSGLGASTAEEGIQYFGDLKRHKKCFLWVNGEDDDAFELAFSKRMTNARKKWLHQFAPGTFLDRKVGKVRYRDFVHRELILFYLADLQRSIPSMVDGLKPCERKILFSAFNHDTFKEYKVPQLCGYVAEHSVYRHGEENIARSIIKMAQDFVGSNNINLLQPKGQFGTRIKGGKDCSKAIHFMYTCLHYQDEGGKKIEPKWYAPIIPMVLVNGSKGIGTGWSSYVPNYNVRDIIDNIRRLINGDEPQTMEPWYRGFKGSIERSGARAADGLTYTVRGVIKQVDRRTLKITELPVCRWTNDYDDFINSMLEPNNNMEPFVQDKRSHCDEKCVDFEIVLSEENMQAAKAEGLEKRFKIKTTISTANMNLIDSNGIIRKYDTPEKIIQDFYQLRKPMYEKRRNLLLRALKLKLLETKNRERFILAVYNKEIIVQGRRTPNLLCELRQKKFDPLRKKRNGSPASAYDYLLSMPIKHFNFAKAEKLHTETEKIMHELDELSTTSPTGLWLKDLANLEMKLSELEIEDEEAAGGGDGVLEEDDEDF